jgi:hypothetical protein
MSKLPRIRKYRDLSEENVISIISIFYLELNKII